MGFCGSPGYRPDKKTMKSLFSTLVGRTTSGLENRGYDLYNNLTGHARSYSPTTYTTPDIEDIYKGVSQSGVEGVKSGLQTGMQNLSSSMSRRGLAGSGINLRQGQQMSSTAADKISDIYREAVEKSGLLKAQYDWQKQQAEDASRQAASQLGLSAASAQYGMSNQNLQNLMNLYTGALGSASQNQPGWGSSLFGGVLGLGTSALTGGALGKGGFLTNIWS